MLKAKRKEIAERIAEAKELGDLSENAEYIEVKEEQGFVESRILALEHKLKNTKVIEHTKNVNEVQLGSTLTVRDQHGESATYFLVGSSEADPMKKKISNESPMGRAFLGRRVGEKVRVETPAATMSFEILAVE